MKKDEVYGIYDREYLILVGGWSNPEYSELEIGQVFGPDKDIGVFGVGPLGREEFGSFQVFDDGVPGSVSTSGGILISTNATITELKGHLDVDLIILVLKKQDNEDRVLIKKDVLEATDNLHWILDTRGEE